MEQARWVKALSAKVELNGGARTSGGRGGMGGSMAAGPDGFCVCPKCGAKIPHQIGLPCTSVSCPQCGDKMVRGTFHQCVFTKERQAK